MRRKENFLKTLTAKVVCRNMLLFRGEESVVKTLSAVLYLYELLNGFIKKNLACKCEMCWVQKNSESLVVIATTRQDLTSSYPGPLYLHM